MTHFKERRKEEVADLSWDTNWDILGIPDTRLKGKRGRKLNHDNYVIIILPR